MDSGKVKMLVFAVGVLGVTAFYALEPGEETPTDNVQTVSPTAENPFVTLSTNPTVKSRTFKKKKQQKAIPTGKLRTFEDEMLKRSPQDDGRARRLAAKNKYFDKLREQLKEIRQDAPTPIGVAPTVDNSAAQPVQAGTAEPNEEIDFPEQPDDFVEFPEDALIDDLPPEEYYEDF